MSCRALRAAVVFAALAGLAGPWAWGSGFHIYEQGAKASGQAVAFVARADDASALYYNPAGLAWMDGRHMSVGASAVFIGDTTFDSEMDLLGSPAFSGGTFEMESNTPLVPHLYYAKGAGDGRLAYGLAVFAPFGLITEWGPNFDGRFSARESDLQSYVVNPNVAYRLTDNWSVAIGLDWMEAELNAFSRNLPPTSPGAPEPLFDLEGDGDEVGWNAALSYRSEDWAFGFTYRSGFEVELEGQATVTVPGAPAPLSRQGASGLLDLPETWAVGVAYLGWDKWEVEFDMHKINWSSFDRLPINLEQGLVVDGEPVTQLVQVENWVDTSSWRLGAARQLGERSELRFGVYWEDRTIPQETLRPSIPDSDRTGFSLGYGYRLGEGIHIDAFAMHIETASRETTLENFQADESVPFGRWDSSIDLLGVTVQFAL